MIIWDTNPTAGYPLNVVSFTCQLVVYIVRIVSVPRKQREMEPCHRSPAVNRVARPGRDPEPPIPVGAQENHCSREVYGGLCEVRTDGLENSGPSSALNCNKSAAGNDALDGRGEGAQDTVFQL